jgi:ketosteroid isomerase-like protein
MDGTVPSTIEGLDMTTHESADDRRAHTDGVIDRAMELLVAHDMTGFAHLWAPTGTMDFPFAAPGQPPHLDGRDAIVDYLSGYTEMLDVRGIVAQTRHHTLDPETVVVEFEVEGIAVEAQNPYLMRYIAVITVHADGIASYRDYWSPLAATDALGVAATSQERAR